MTETETTTAAKMAAPSTLKDLILSTTTFKVNVSEIASQLELSSYEAASRYLLSKGFEIPPAILQESVQIGLAEARQAMMAFFGGKSQFLTVSKRGARASPSTATPVPAASGASTGGSGDSRGSSETSSVPPRTEGAVTFKRWNYPLEMAPTAKDATTLCAWYKKEKLQAVGKHFGLDLDMKLPQAEMAAVLFEKLQESKVEPIEDGWEEI